MSWFTGPYGGEGYYVHRYVNLTALVCDRFNPWRSTNGPIYVEQDIPWQ